MGFGIQGLNNHIHIQDYIDNPILQLKMAEELIEIWIDKIKKIHPKEKVIIYLNGAVDSTVCIYLMSRPNKIFLNEFDKYLKIQKCIIKNLVCK